ncbi:MAG TPA: HAD family hydrolase [Firmicutes bacterium]|jgi:HAD superfamily hydrolase (TIGR01549 family)|nr:HAD family hydrolase [Bacillota bacterium]
MYECVIFDVDGTLLDTEKATLLSLQKLLWEETSTLYPVQELSFVMGLTGVESLRRLGVKNAEAANERWNRYIKDYYHLVKVFEDIDVVLQELIHRGLKTGIVTSRTGQELNKDLGLFQLGKYFPYAVCSDDVLKPKPDPEPILKFVEVAQVHPQRTIYIGDTLNDLLAARGAGVDFGLAVWGSGCGKLPGSKYRFTSPREIKDVVLVE